MASQTVSPNEAAIAQALLDAELRRTIDDAPSDGPTEPGELTRADILSAPGVPRSGRVVRVRKRWATIVMDAEDVE